MTVHRYATALTWTGSTAVGYEDYGRAHAVTAGPTALTMSSDPAFLGDPSLPNPEQLVVMAAASCQLLSFLAVAARARLDVRDYRDEATATMSQEHRPMRLDEIVLRPHIVMATGPSQDRVRHLVEVAHKECFIANSLSTPVRVEPTVTFTG